MDDLLEWLRSQQGGIETYLDFQRRALALRSLRPEHAALARLLADLAGRFVEKYYGEPLSADVSETALAYLVERLEGAVAAHELGPAHYLGYLNETATRDALER